MNQTGTQPELTAVRSGHRIDEPALWSYLAARLPGFTAPATLLQYAGGQSNPTFLIRGAGGREFVLRKKPPGALLPSAHLIEREYRVLGALRGQPVPVPRVLLFCEDASVIGTVFYVMEHVAGRIIRDIALPSASATERGAVYRDFVGVLARLHSVDWRAIGLADFGKSQNYVARQLDRWTRQYRASSVDNDPTVNALAAWLHDHLPATDRTTLIHGDYRLGNVIIDPSEPRLVAVVDWELATLGDPLCDLAYACMMYRLPRDLEAYSGLAGRNLAELGIPGEQELLATYCSLVGRSAVPEWNFYLAFSLFRLTAIAQGVHARALQGNAADRRGLQYGRVAKIGAQLGLSIARGSDQGASP